MQQISPADTVRFRRTRARHLFVLTMPLVSAYALRMPSHILLDVEDIRLRGIESHCVGSWQLSRNATSWPVPALGPWHIPGLSASEVLYSYSVPTNYEVAVPGLAGVARMAWRCTQHQRTAPHGPVGTAAPCGCSRPTLSPPARAVKAVRRTRARGHRRTQRRRDGHCARLRRAEAAAEDASCAFAIRSVTESQVHSRLSVAHHVHRYALDGVPPLAALGARVQWREDLAVDGRGTVRVPLALRRRPLGAPPKRVLVVSASKPVSRHPTRRRSAGEPPSRVAKSTAQDKSHGLCLPSTRRSWRQPSPPPRNSTRLPSPDSAARQDAESLWVHVQGLLLLLAARSPRRAPFRPPIHPAFLVAFLLCRSEDAPALKRHPLASPFARFLFARPFPSTSNRRSIYTL